MRHRLVVIEGPDGAGKTTLAEELCSRLGFNRRHEGPPPADLRDVFEYYVGRLTLAVADTFAAPQVLDRFALGERVYGPVLRGQDRLGGRGWMRVRDVLDEVGALRVLCLPPRSACRDAWLMRAAAKGELITDPAVFDRTYDAWLSYRFDRGQVVHDWTRPGSTVALVRAVAGRDAEVA